MAFCRAATVNLTRPSSLKLRTARAAFPVLSQTQCRSKATVPFKLPAARNEPNVGPPTSSPDHEADLPQPTYKVGSPERAKVEEALKKMRSQLPLPSAIFYNGVSQKIHSNQDQVMPSEHATTFTNYPMATKEQVSASIESALKAKKSWEEAPFVDKAAIFQRAAELVTTKYRYELIAATMLGQGKNIWQAEIDAAAELADFWRLNCHYAAELLGRQPERGTDGMWR